MSTLGIKNPGASEASGFVSNHFGYAGSISKAMTLLKLIRPRGLENQRQRYDDVDTA